MYVSTKRYGHEAGYSICYRQHRTDSHCRLLHGYSLAFEFEFESETLDVRNWVCDFGGFKTLKEFLDYYFDHTLLVAKDDPMLSVFKALHDAGLASVREVERVGCEGIALALFEYVNGVWLEENGYRSDHHRVWCRKVRVYETPNNSAWVEMHEDEYDDYVVFKAEKEKEDDECPF